MTLNVSPRIRLFAIIGVAGALALGAGMMLLGSSQADAVAAGPLPAPARVVAKPAPVKQAAVRRTAVPARKPAVAIEGVPAPVAAALARHSVVVVSLVTPGSSVDKAAQIESAAGAKDVGAGFVALNVVNEKYASPIAERLGVIEAPAVLVYKRPNRIFVHLSGFADRETVAQAAANAGA